MLDDLGNLAASQSPGLPADAATVIRISGWPRNLLDFPVYSSKVTLINYLLGFPGSRSECFPRVLNRSLNSIDT
jgi:hypothetical protein